MQKYILLFVFIFSATFLMGQDLVEKFKSEPGERMFNRGDLIGKSQEAAIKDFDGDGKPDVMQVIMSGGSTMIFTVLTSSTQTILDFYVEFDGISINMSTIKFWGLFNLDGEGMPELFILEDNLHIIGLNEGTTYYRYELKNIFGFFDVDGDGLTDIIQYDRDARQTTVLGQGEKIGLDSENEEVISTIKSKNDFQMITKHESIDTLDLGFESVSLESLSDFDLNGDGNTDIVLLRENETGQSTGIRIINGKNRNQALSLVLPEDEDISRGFRGFFDVDGDGMKEAYFGNQTTIDRDGNLSKLPEDFEIFGFLDIDGDNVDDILGYNTAKNVVTILGAPLTTSTNNVWAKNIGITIQPIFPNPVHATANFKFELEENQRVRLDILQINGQILTTVLDEQLPAGVHQTQWDTQGLPSGMYLYRFSTAKGQVTNGIIKE